MEKLHIMLNLTPIEMTCRKLSGFTFLGKHCIYFQRKKVTLYFKLLFFLDVQFEHCVNGKYFNTGTINAIGIC